MTWAGVVLAIVAFAAQIAVGSGRALQQMAEEGQCPDSVTPLQLDSLDLLSGRLSSDCQLNYEISSAALAGTPCAYDISEPKGWVQAEVWDMEGVDKVANQSGSVGDPLLMIARGQQPQAMLTTKDRLEFVPAWTAVDPRGSQLAASYQQVVLKSSDHGGGGTTWRISLKNTVSPLLLPITYTLRVQCLALYPCPTPLMKPDGTPASSCSSRGRCEAPSVELRAAVAQLATAAAAADTNSSRAPATSRPKDGSGSQATEGPMDVSSPEGILPPSVCSCRSGFTDVGCNLRETRLTVGNITSSSIPAGSWQYFSLEVPPGVEEVLVEMGRSSGDPLLFVKPLAAGVLPGGVPTALDYATYSDSASFQQRVNRHSRALLQPPPGTVQVAIFNFNYYLQETAKVVVQARYTTREANHPMCAGNCSYSGKCTASNTCKCFQGYEGQQCEGPSRSLDIGQRVRGVGVAPGDWVFWQLHLHPDASWRKRHGLEFVFAASAGAPVLMAKLNRAPTLLDNDFIFKSSNGFQTIEKFRVTGDELHAGVYTIAIFNMDYFTHSRFNYELLVRLASAQKLALTPYFSIVLGVAVAVMMCVAGTLIRRCMRIRRRRQPLEEGVELPEVPHRPRGMDPALVQSFPIHEYSKATAIKLGEADESSGIVAPQPVDVSLGGVDALEEAAAAAGAVERDSDSNTEHSTAAASLAECTVCLEEWGEGDVLRTLPCRHFFHVKCIDRWLSRHGSCPICRATFGPVAPLLVPARRQHRTEAAETPIHGFGPTGLRASDLPVHPAHRSRRHRGRQQTSLPPPPGTSAHSATATGSAWRHSGTASHAATPAATQHLPSPVSHNTPWSMQPQEAAASGQTATADDTAPSCESWPRTAMPRTADGNGGGNDSPSMADSNPCRCTGASAGATDSGEAPAGEGGSHGIDRAPAQSSNRLCILSDSLARYWTAR